MGINNKNIQDNISYLARYCIENLGATYLGQETIRPPFPCLTGVADTSGIYGIDQNVYPGIVAVGVDTLELNCGVAEYISSDVFRKLEEAKAQAISGGYKSQGIPIELFGNEFMVQSRGSKGGYEYLLRNGDVDLQIMPDARSGEPSPEIRAIFRSPYIWRVGEVPAYNEVIKYLNGWSKLVYCQVSRADLCVDKVMPLPEIDRKVQVVSRLRSRDLYYGGDFQSGQRETGYQFGRGGMSCRFYDKLYEISVKGHGHIIPVWTANGWDGISPVSRFELQLRRKGLRLFDTSMDFVTFQERKADIWAYGTDRFLRIVNPETATRKERAEVTDYWKVYQDCVVLFGDRCGILPFKQVNDDWKPLVAQARGCIAGAFARLTADVGNDEAIRVLEKEWGTTFPQVVIEDGLQQKARFSHLN